MVIMLIPRKTLIVCLYQGKRLIVTLLYMYFTYMERHAQGNLRGKWSFYAVIGYLRGNCLLARQLFTHAAIVIYPVICRFTRQRHLVVLRDNRSFTRQSVILRQLVILSVNWSFTRELCQNVHV